MRAVWVRYMVVFLLAFVTGAALMVVSHRVQRAERQIAKIERNIAHERQTIRILEAEWAFLNNPERLEVLASTYLNLTASQPEQMISDLDAVFEVLATEDVVVSSSDAKVYDISYKPSDVSVVPSRKPSVRMEKSPEEQKFSAVTGGER